MKSYCTTNKRMNNAFTIRAKSPVYSTSYPALTYVIRFPPSSSPNRRIIDIEAPHKEEHKPFPHTIR